MSQCVHMIRTLTLYVLMEIYLPLKGSLTFMSMKNKIIALYSSGSGFKVLKSYEKKNFKVDFGYLQLDFLNHTVDFRSRHI